MGEPEKRDKKEIEREKRLAREEKEKLGYIENLYVCKLCKKFNLRKIELKVHHLSTSQNIPIFEKCNLLLRFKIVLLNYHYPICVVIYIHIYISISYVNN